VKPFFDDTLRGLFSTRYPRRPNQIGITVVRLLNRRRNVLTVRGIDIIDKTPLLDIKPYVPEFAVGTRVRIGWLKGKLWSSGFPKVHPQPISSQLSKALIRNRIAST
jgi:tRNA (Thr-GGU) A37 N-methylase